MEKALRIYDINFAGLSVGEHVYSYAIGDDFFELFQESPITKGNGKVQLLFDKQTGHFELSFRLEGHVEIECDRCTANINYPIFNNFKLYIKFHGEDEVTEDTDEVIYIPRTDASINVAQYIYEYIILSVPMVKNCDYLEEQYKNCNQEVLKLLNREPEAENKPIADDDRWSALKNIKFDN